MTAVSAALLSALIVARVTRRVRVTVRTPPRAGRGGRRRARHDRNYDYAPMLTAIARQVRSGTSLTAALNRGGRSVPAVGRHRPPTVGGRPADQALTTVESG